MILFVLFAIFQNFSFPNKHLDNLTNKNFYKKNLHKFVPTYSFKNSIGGGVEVPYGYKEEIQRKIASANQRIIFDRKKFLKEGAEALPIYKDIQDFIKDVASSDEPSASDEACVATSVESSGACIVRQNYHAINEHDDESGSIKVRANPLRQTASISVPGEIYSQLNYDADSNRVNVQFRTNISDDAGVRLELDSLDQSGKINIDLSW